MTKFNSSKSNRSDSSRNCASVNVKSLTPTHPASLRMTTLGHGLGTEERSDVDAVLDVLPRRFLDPRQQSDRARSISFRHPPDEHGQIQNEDVRFLREDLRHERRFATSVRFRQKRARPRKPAPARGPLSTGSLGRGLRSARSFPRPRRRRSSESRRGSSADSHGGYPFSTRGARRGRAHLLENNGGSSEVRGRSRRNRHACCRESSTPHSHPGPAPGALVRYHSHHAP